jgi:hypothetical protein
VELQHPKIYAQILTLLLWETHFSNMWTLFPMYVSHMTFWHMEWYCLLVYGAEPFLEAANCAVTQELPSNLWNVKVHYCVHNSPPLVPILSHIDPVYTVPSCLSKIYFNIVHPSTSWSVTLLNKWILIIYLDCLAFSSRNTNMSFYNMMLSSRIIFITFIILIVGNWDRFICELKYLPWIGPGLCRTILQENW